MSYKIVGAAVALVMGTGMAFAEYGDDDKVMVNVDGEMVEVDVETAAAACGMEPAMIQDQVGSELAVCEIDQATAEEHGIEVEDS